MRCHYCDRESDIAVERRGVTVGLCEAHFRERVEALADADWAASLRDELEL